MVPPNHIDDFGRRGTIKRAVANILGDQEFHCRTCLKSEVDSDQIAGGSGIQGLKRAGYVMEKETRYCRLCSKRTTWDRWTGKRQTIISTGQGNISDALKMRVFNYYRGRDPVLDTQLHPRYALVDHRLPMIRWGDWAPSNDPHMSDRELQETFQLLRNSDGENHNLLKSRACESCVNTGRRPPFIGVEYWYDARGRDWPREAPETGERAKTGCTGCGWYDVLAWKQNLGYDIEGSGI